MNQAPCYVVLEKPIGQTPLEAITAWRGAYPEYAQVPATYAGRLDPMASGKLLVLLGDECARRDHYANLDKEYEIEVVLDLSTDTGDALGLPSFEKRETHPESGELQKELPALSGTHTLPYPAFSSKPVDGKPLFQYALEGALDTIAIPTHEERIYRAALSQESELSASQLRERIQEILRVVPRSDEPSKVLGADFRQDEVRASWNELLTTIPERTFTIISLRITCGTGTYMRTLAQRFGRALGTNGFALSIHRTKIGTYEQTDSEWSKLYA